MINFSFYGITNPAAGTYTLYLSTSKQTAPIIEYTSIYNTEDLKYRILRYSNGGEPISYTVYEVIEKNEI